MADTKFVEAYKIPTRAPTVCGLVSAEVGWAYVVSDRADFLRRILRAHVWTSQRLHNGDRRYL
jgi:hypothetical protein